MKKRKFIIKILSLFIIFGALNAKDDKISAMEKVMLHIKHGVSLDYTTFELGIINDADKNTTLQQVIDYVDTKLYNKKSNSNYKVYNEGLIPQSLYNHSIEDLISNKSRYFIIVKEGEEKYQKVSDICKYLNFDYGKLVNSFKYYYNNNFFEKFILKDKISCGDLEKNDKLNIEYEPAKGPSTEELPFLNRLVRRPSQEEIVEKLCLIKKSDLKEVQKILSEIFNIVTDSIPITEDDDTVKGQSVVFPNSLLDELLTNIISIWNPFVEDVRISMYLWDYSTKLQYFQFFIDNEYIPLNEVASKMLDIMSQMDY